MHYSYKAIKDFALRVERELGLTNRGIKKKGKTLICYLGEILRIDPKLSLNIMIGIYDKVLHNSRFYDYHSCEGYTYLWWTFNNEMKALIKNARRDGKPAIYFSVSVSNIYGREFFKRQGVYRLFQPNDREKIFDCIKNWVSDVRQNTNFEADNVAALKVINSRGFKDPHYDEACEIISVQKEGKWGLLDKQGNVLCEPMYNDISNFQNGTAVAHLDDKAMLINTNGEVVKIYDYNQVERLPNGYAKVQQNNKWGFINPDGEEIVSPQFDVIHIYSKEDIGEIRVGRKWGFITTEGKVICPAKYEKTLSFSEGRAAVKFNYKWGLINEQGKEIVEPKYDEITDACDGIIYVCKDGKWGYLDKEFDEACELKYEYDWFKGLTLGDKCYKPNADGVLEEYVEEPVDDDDLPF